LKKHAIVTDRARPSPDDRAAESGPRPLLGAVFEDAAARSEQLPSDGAAEIAFAGRSNAGKSSAINALARHRGLAYASRTPGRTQQINFFLLRSGARAVDLPGYGYAAVSKGLKREWQTFLWDYVLTRSTLVGLVLVVDARHGLRPLDRELISAFVTSARPMLVLATKADKLGTRDRRDAVNRIHTELAQMRAPVADVLAFSATRGEGVNAADRTIATWLPQQYASRSEAADRKRPRDQGE
jgi:GTP-binding protein